MDEATLVRATQSLRTAILQPLTLLAISLLLCSWKSKSYLERTIDSAICLALLIWNSTWRPLLSLSFTLAYAVWYFLPGSLSSLDSPSHARFMRNLQIVKPSEGDDGEEECRVCWDDEQELAKLPCNHYCCRRCLQVMGKTRRNTCPICRRALFSGNDQAAFLIFRANMTCSTVSLALLLLRTYLEIQESLYMLACISFVDTGAHVALVAFRGYLIWEYGEDWWRGGPSAVGGTKLSMRLNWFLLFVGVLDVWQGLIGSESYLN